MRDTSRAALMSIDPTKVDGRVLMYAQHFGGVTCDEVEQALNMRHQTASAAIWRLCKGGRLNGSENRRPTRSGRLATVWRAA
jgi:hypothetical protein